MSAEARPSSDAPGVPAGHQMLLPMEERAGGAAVESSHLPDGRATPCGQFPTVRSGDSRMARWSQRGRPGGCGAGPGRTVVPLVRDGRRVGSLALTTAPAHAATVGRPSENRPPGAAGHASASAVRAVTRVAGLPPTLRRP